MTVEVNGIAYIQMTVNNAEACLPFREKLCHFLEMKTLIRNDTTVYCIGSHTGILVREAPKKSNNKPFDQDTTACIIFVSGRMAMKMSVLSTNLSFRN